MTQQQVADAMDEFAARMAEHVEGIVILSSNSENQLSNFIKRGRGNFYLQVALAEQFVKDSDAEDQARWIGREFKDDNDTSEDWKK